MKFLDFSATTIPDDPMFKLQNTANRWKFLKMSHAHLLHIRREVLPRFAEADPWVVLINQRIKMAIGGLVENLCQRCLAHLLFEDCIHAGQVDNVLRCVLDHFSTQRSLLPKIVIRTHFVRDLRFHCVLSIKVLLQQAVQRDVAVLIAVGVLLLRVFSVCDLRIEHPRNLHFILSKDCRSIFSKIMENLYIIIIFKNL